MSEVINNQLIPCDSDTAAECAGNALWYASVQGFSCVWGDNEFEYGIRTELESQQMKIEIILHDECAHSLKIQTKCGPTKTDCAIKKHRHYQRQRTMIILHTIFENVCKRWVIRYVSFICLVLIYGRAYACSLEPTARKYCWRPQILLVGEKLMRLHSHGTHLWRLSDFHCIASNVCVCVCNVDELVCVCLTIIRLHKLCWSTDIQ